MQAPSSVFEATYQQYLDQIGQVDFNAAQHRLGITVEQCVASLPLLDTLYHISPAGIVAETGKTPTLDICVILCRYLLMGADIGNDSIQWIAYRDLKDSGPLTVYWANDVEGKITHEFSENTAALATACERLGGLRADGDYPYDLSYRFDFLPRIPALLLFNRKDEEFSASCSLLFERHVDQFLDAESLGILGALFAKRLLATLKLGS